MEEKNNQLGKSVQPETGKWDMQVSDIIAWALNHVKFITASIVVCMAVAFLYIKHAQPIYQRDSSVMLRSDNTGKAQMSELATFADLGMFNTGIDVSNELHAFQSPVTMEEVVKRLGINTSYTSRNWIGRTTDWYDKTPIRADFRNIVVEHNDNVVKSFSFTVDKNNDGNFSLSDFKINGQDVDADVVSAKPSALTQTPVAKVRISPTLFFAENFDAPITVTYIIPSDMAKICLRKLSANLADKFGTVINFSYSDPSPKRAEDILNTLIVVYNEDWIRYMNESAISTSKFINERLQVIESELGSVDNNVARFKSHNKLLDVDAQTKQVTEESTRYADQAFLASNQLQVARYVRNYLVDQTKAFSLLPANSGIGNQSVEQQIGDYNKMLLSRQKLVDNSSETNPLVNDLNNQLTLMRASILRAIDNLISTLQIQVDRIAAQESDIAGRISSSPGKVKELITIERQQKIKEQLYLYLLQKREENELQASFVVRNTRVIKPATGDDVPVSPKRIVALAAGLFLGLAFPFTFMYLSNMLNTTVRGKKDIEQLSAPMIGEIPQHGKRRHFGWMRYTFNRAKDESEAPTLVVSSHNRNIINEAFRVVRTNMDFLLANAKGTQVQMITSYNPGSGKTFISLNLAACLSLKGKRVAVVDRDMRKSSFAKIIDSPRTGIATFLNGQAKLDDIIVSGTIAPNLDIIPAGSVPPNPAELLLSDRLQELFAELRNRYDYVLCDCPPVDIVADTAVIARQVDRSVFVIRVGVMDRRMLSDVERLYTEKRLPNMAILINGTQMSSGYGYSRYGYGNGRYGYGYGGYGYGRSKDDKSDK